MPDTTFNSMEKGAQEEVRQLSAELGWSLEYTANHYLEIGRSLAVQAQLKQMRHTAPLLSLVDHKKGLERASKEQE